MSFETILLSNTLHGLMIRFFFNLIVLFILIRLVYYRFVKKEEYVFSFFLMGTIIFLLVSLLTTVNIQLGMALGLFAVFGILRFRTVNYTAKDMTYIFTIIGVSVINSQANIPPPILGALTVNSIIIILAVILELFLKKNALTRVVIRYNKLKLLNPDLRNDLLKDLTARTGLNIEKVKILRINIEKGRAMLEIFYKDKSAY
jgi:Domain of unknown function (DUF4956)